MALTNYAPAVQPGAGSTLKNLRERNIMKSLEIVVVVIAYIVLAIVLIALSPLLIELIKVANHLSHFFGN